MDAENFYKRYDYFFAILQLFAVGLLWLLSIPTIVCIFPANVSLYKTVLYVIRKGNGKVFKSFFSSFPDSFRRTWIYGLLMILIIAILLFFMRFSNIEGEEVKFWKYMFYVYASTGILLLTLQTFVIPVFVHYTGKTIDCLKAGYTLSVKHLFTSITILLCWYLGFLIVYYVPILILFIPGFIILISTMVLERFFK